jgi:transposase
MARGEFEGVLNGGLTCASHSAAPCLTEVRSPIVRRRCERWPDEERERITATIAAVARRNGVGLGLLHYWRRQVRDTGSVEELRFVPVAVADPAPLSAAGVIEIAVEDARVRIEGDVDVARTARGVGGYSVMMGMGRTSGSWLPLSR